MCMPCFLKYAHWNPEGLTYDEQVGSYLIVHKNRFDTNSVVLNKQTTESAAFEIFDLIHNEFINNTMQDKFGLLIRNKEVIAAYGNVKEMNDFFDTKA